MFGLVFFNSVVSLLIIQSELVYTHSNINVPEHRYKPTWHSLDKRPLPQWYDDVKIGIFLHWGVFSVPSFHSEWFWSNWKNNGKDIVDFMKKNYPPNFSYQDFARDFTAEFFDPQQWAELFKNSGAKYVVLTSKHHEGFTLWPSKYSFSWNSNDTGPHRDLIGELSKTVRKSGLIFGLYHSLYEWFNPLYVQDKKNNFTTKYFVENKILPEMVELINNYKPKVLWSDGDWEARDTYWNSTEFLAWLYNDSPVKDTIVVNDRWGIDIPCKHGDFYTCKDRYNPGVLQPHKWENAMTVDRDSWGYRRNANLNDYFSTFELIKTMTETVSCGGNILINIGPTKEGTIIPIFQERLLDLGNWLKINGEAIYRTKPWKYQNDTTNNSVWYTKSKNSKTIYAIVLQWPKNNQLEIGAIQPYVDITTTDISFLGYPSRLVWKIRGEFVLITFPDRATVKNDWAWVLKIQQNNYIN